jgi:hypothetical protein
VETVWRGSSVSSHTSASTSITRRTNFCPCTKCSRGPVGIGKIQNDSLSYSRTGPEGGRRRIDQHDRGSRMSRPARLSWRSLAREPRSASRQTLASSRLGACYFKIPRTTSESRSNLSHGSYSRWSCGIQLAKGVCRSCSRSEIVAALCSRRGLNRSHGSRSFTVADGRERTSRKAGKVDLDNSRHFIYHCKPVWSGDGRARHA